MARRRAKDDESRVLLDDVLAACDHMSRLTDDLLLLSRLDAGRLAVTTESLDLRDLLSDVERQAGRLAADRGVRLKIDAAPAFARADPVRLRQVLLILIDNAVRHSSPGGEVLISCRPEGNDIALNVIDTGEGIAPEHLAQVFDRFYRVDAARGAGSGSGLGLAIAKGLVEAQHGMIRIESQLGTGTRVTLTHPRAVQPGPSL